MVRLIGVLDHVPDLMLGRRSQVLARNALHTAVLGVPMKPGSSFTQWLLQDRDARSRILNWAEFANTAVGALLRDRPAPRPPAPVQADRGAPPARR